MPITVAQAIGEFLDACRADGLKAPTVRWYEGKLKPFLRTYGEMAITELTNADTRAYVRSLYDRDVRYVGVKKKSEKKGGLSIESIRGHIRTLKRLMAWCVEEYALDPKRNPMRGIKMPRAPRPVPKAISTDDIRALLNAGGQSPVDLRNRSFIALLADTGCRLQGALGLRVSDLLLDECRVLLFEKGDKGRVMGISQYTVERLREWLAVRPAEATTVFCAMGTNTYAVPMTISGVHAMLNKLAAAANVHGRFNPHSFRHSFARRWFSQGGDANTLASLMGHSDPKITIGVYGAFMHEEALERFDRLALMDKLMKGGES